MICIDYLIIIIIINYYDMLLFFMTRRKCKGNYKAENGELYFRKSGRVSKKDQKLSVMMYGRNAFVHFITYEYSLYINCYLQLSFTIYIHNNIIL